MGEIAGRVRQGGRNSGWNWSGHWSGGLWWNCGEGFVEQGRCEAGHALDLHVTMLEQPLVVGFQQHGTDQALDSASHNIADFAWRASLDRDDLRAKYGEGFRAGVLTRLHRSSAAPPEDRAYGSAQHTSRTAAAGLL